MLFAISLLLPLAATNPLPYAGKHRLPQCFDFDVPLSFKALSLVPSFPPFKNHYESVDLLNKLSARNSQQGPSPIKGTNPDTQIDVTIHAKYCKPAKHDRNIVQVLTHGLGFDSSYWSFGGADSEYNYIKAATEAGYATFSYDRIGNGKSTKSDPYTINQLQIEAEVLSRLTAHVRNRDIPALKHIRRPRKVVHVGHSYGSQATDMMLAKYPGLSDGIVLTGFSRYLNSSQYLAISSNFHLARENQPERFGNLSSGYLTWGDELSNQYSFLHWPNFSPKVLAESERTKWPFAIGELLSSNITVAPQYKGPVLVISGEFDLVFCQSYCTTAYLQDASALFPAAKLFQAYVQPNTGHGMNLHYNATGAYSVINDFFTRNL